MKKGRCGTMTHDDKRNGTTTPLAALNALNALNGKMIGRCMRQHRHQDFIRFLNTVEAAVSAGTLVHAIADIMRFLAENNQNSSHKPRSLDRFWLGVWSQLRPRSP